MFFGCAALLIAIGTAANTQIFTLLNAVLLRPLPVRDAQSLVQLFDIRPKVPRSPYYEYRFYKELVATSSTLFEFIGHEDFTTVLERAAGTDRVHVDRVTDNYFRDLGVEARLGRVFGAGDDHIAVLSYAYWLRAFARDPNVVGRKIRLHGHSFTVVGVASQQFNGTTIDSSPDLWIRFADTMDLQRQPSADMNRYPVEIIARLRPGVSVRQAEQEIEFLYARYRKQPSSNSFGGYLTGRLEVRSISHGLSPLRDQSHNALILLFAGTAILLMMVCANVGGLLLARSTAREKETAIRLAVGASRMRIAGQNLADGVLFVDGHRGHGWRVDRGGHDAAAPPGDAACSRNRLRPAGTPRPDDRPWSGFPGRGILPAHMRADRSTFDSGASLAFQPIRHARRAEGYAERSAQPSLPGTALRAANLPLAPCSFPGPV